MFGIKMPWTKRKEEAERKREAVRQGCELYERAYRTGQELRRFDDEQAIQKRRAGIIVLSTLPTSVPNKEK